MRARDAGFEVVYQGIRLTPAQIVAAAVRGGRATWSGCRCCPARTCEVVPEVLDGLRAAGLDDVPVVVGGIIPPADAAALRAAGVARVFTPKDFALTDIIDELVTVIRTTHDCPHADPQHSLRVGLPLPTEGRVSS